MCPSCNADLEIRVFPALIERKTALDLQAMRSEEGEATCYNHAGKRANSSCSQCGRFLCALCTVEFQGGTWCPSCLSAASARQKAVPLVNRRMLYDSIALAVATLPALLIYPAVLTGPAALFLSIRYWNRPSSIVPRTKWRFVVAILLALAELALLVTVVYFAVQGIRRTQNIR